MKVIIFAGGKGTRLWPLSDKTCPKQLLEIEDSFSLLQKTLLRFLAKVPPSSILVVTSSECYPLALKQCQDICPTEKISLLVEPKARGTAVALALALRFLEEEGKLSPDEMVIAAPSDCFFSSNSLFLAKVEEASLFTKSGALVLFGIPPFKIETGYGYLKLGDFINGAFKVEEFIEKPSSELAKSLLSSGNVLWNSGHLAFQADTFWKESKLHCQDLFSFKEMEFSKCLEKMESLPALSLDYEVLEKSENAFVFLLSSEWLDIGCWDNIYELLPKDINGNSKKGNVLEIGTKNSLLYAESRTLATIDVEDLLIIETKKAVLIAKKGSSQKVRMLAEKEEQVTDSKVLEENPFFKVEKITLTPSEKRIFQNTLHKERLLILKGIARVEVDSTLSVLGAGDSLQMRLNSLYRITNNTENLLELLQIRILDLAPEPSLC